MGLIIDLFYLTTGRSRIYRMVAILRELFTIPDFPIAMPGLYPIFWRSANPRLLSAMASLRPSSRLSASINLCGLFCCLLSSSVTFFFLSISWVLCWVRLWISPGRISSFTLQHPLDCKLYNLFSLLTYIFFGKKLLSWKQFWILKCMGWL